MTSKQDQNSPKTSYVVTVNTTFYSSLSASMKGRFQAEKCQFEFLGDDYYNVHVQDWPWLRCEETTLVSWLEYSGMEILSVQENRADKDQKWAEPKTRAQENAWFERLARRIDENTVTT